jgi:hypothetical protein
MKRTHLIQETFSGILLAGVVCLAGETAVALTPDGETPAEESVCDVLAADGITKGLYGLCIAFCEAQDLDHACVEDPETCAKSASRILANYEKKRTADDPTMPCIISAPSCPCWDGGPDALFPETTLADVWLNHSPANCSGLDLCFDQDSGGTLDSEAICFGSNGLLQTAAFAFSSSGVCLVADVVGSGRSLNLDGETAAICLAEHDAFTAGGTFPGYVTFSCGLPTP